MTLRSNQIYVHVGFVAAITTMYLGLFISTHQGSEAAKLAVKTTTRCVTLASQDKTSAGKEYNTCIQELERLVWTMIDFSEIDLMSCKPGVVGREEAWCEVWASGFPRKVLITNKKLIEYIKAPASNKPRLHQVTSTSPPPPSMPGFKEFLGFKTKKAINRANDFKNTVERATMAKRSEVVGMVKEEARKARNSAMDLRLNAEMGVNGVLDDAKDKLGRANKLAKELNDKTGERAKDALASVKNLGRNI